MAMNQEYIPPANSFNGEYLPAQQKEVATEMAIARQAQEVQAAMIVAKRFPRDEYEAYNRIMKSCERLSLAERSEYSYPRGGEKVSGPTIRLAEVLARNWGNIDFGIMELEQRAGESTMMAYAWDLETNTRQTRIFQVKHERKAKGKINQLDDPRDIYELTANQGARRVRACILGIIPGDVVEAAINKCHDTLAKGGGATLEDKIRQMISVFDKRGVTKEMLEKYIGCPAENFTSDNLRDLLSIFNAIRDGVSKREDYFDVPSANKAGASSLEEEFKAKAGESGQPLFGGDGDGTEQE